MRELGPIRPRACCNPFESAANSDPLVQSPHHLELSRVEKAAQCLWEVQINETVSIGGLQSRGRCPTTAKFLSLSPCLTRSSNEVEELAVVGQPEHLAHLRPGRRRSFV